MFIDPTTAAVQKSISLKHGQTLQVRGTLIAESIAIEIPDGAGGWKSFKKSSATVVMDSNNEEYAPAGNTLVRVNKPSTTNAVGIAVI